MVRSAHAERTILTIMGQMRRIIGVFVEFIAPSPSNYVCLTDKPPDVGRTVIKAAARRLVVNKLGIGRPDVQIPRLPHLQTKVNVVIRNLEFGFVESSHFGKYLLANDETRRR